MTGALGPRGAAPENGEDQGQHGEGRWREKGRKRDGKTGAQMVAADRDGWRDCVEALVEALCATRHEEDR